MGACFSASTAPTEEDAAIQSEPPESYEFQSRYEAADSVSYLERTTEHVLIADISHRIGELEFILEATEPPFDDGAQPSEVRDLLGELFDGPPPAEQPLGLTTSPAAQPRSYRELEALNLAQRVAANQDYAHRDFSSSLPGWSTSTLDRAVPDAASLIQLAFELLDDAAVRASTATHPPSPADPSERLPTHITAGGVDLRQLVESLLLGSVVYHQATDRFLDGGESCTDTEGLCASNAEPMAGAGYTPLEHRWDQAFGAFGASRFYGEFRAGTLARGARFRDTSENGQIDLQAEYNFLPAWQAAVRDADANRSEEFMSRLWLAFRTGRHLITSSPGELDPARRAMLLAIRDEIRDTWEALLAATIIADINGLLGTLCPCGDPAFEFGHPDFVDAAAEWSRAKGYALSLRLNPASRLSETDYLELHRLLGPAPYLVTTADDPELQTYLDNLRQARELLGNTFDFASQNLGDDMGDGGW